MLVRKDIFRCVFPRIFPLIRACFHLYKVIRLRSVTPDTIAMKLFNGRLAARCKQYSEIHVAICWTKGRPAASGPGRCAFIAQHRGSQLTIDHERTASFWSSRAVLSSASRWCVTAIVYQVCGTFSINPSSFDDRAAAKRTIIRHMGAILRSSSLARHESVPSVIYCSLADTHFVTNNPDFITRDSEEKDEIACMRARFYCRARREHDR